MPITNWEQPELIFAGDVTMNDIEMADRRQLDHYELVYFPKGSRTIYEVEGSNYTLSEPCFVLTRPDSPHVYKLDPFGYSCFSIKFKLAEPEQYQMITTHNRHVIVATYCTMEAALFDRICELYSSAPEMWQQRSTQMLSLLLSELGCLDEIKSSTLPGSTLPVQLEQAMAYIDTHLQEELSISQIAILVGWSHEHFTRQFTIYFGISPREAILRRRIDRSCQLLAEGSMSVKQIAYAVGFNDEHYFSRVFMKIKGMTATKYKKDVYLIKRYQMSAI